MIKKDKKKYFNLSKAYIASISAILITLYVIFSLIIFPTPFIGGSGTLNFELIGTPIVGILISVLLLKKCAKWREKIIVTLGISFLCGFVSSFISPMNFCGLWFIMLPLFGISSTVFAYIDKKYNLFPLIWITLISVLVQIKYYLIIISIPHLIAIAIGLISSLNSLNLIKNKEIRFVIKIVFCCVIGTISEWCALNVYAAFVLNLPTLAWFGIMPLVFIERGFAVIGGSIISISIIKVLSQRNEFKKDFL